MKRFLLLATAVAFLAAGCQKTEVENEVLTPIGFSTKVGKQMKSIVGTTFDVNQPFGVYTYGHQSTTTTEIMNNIEIAQIDGTWKATNNIAYYWPNDATTTLNFYAYSPYLGTNQGANKDNVKNHQKLNGTLTHTEDGGFSIVGYQHNNMYVDFMVATDVKNAKYNDETTNTSGKVGLTFNHRMTQIVFTVKLDANYSDITFKLKSITLNNIKNKANITNGIFTNDASGNASYTVYPAVKETETNGAPNLTDNQTADLVIDGSINEITEIIPVTMIPQAFDQEQSFTVVYSIAGTGVASETVTKTFKFATPTSPAWDANKKITYNLNVGLKQITFDPKVADWSTASGSYDITPNAAN